MPRRVILYVLLALAVPLPAIALSGGGVSATPTSLQVSASLSGCGTAGASVVCEINATWSEVSGATRYTASVTRADGSVIDFGDVGGGSGTFSVPYAGNGTYTVTVLAYGTPPGAEEPEVIAKGRSGDGGGRKDARPEVFDSVDAGGTSTGAPAADDDGPPAGEEPPAEEPEEPDCEEPTDPPVDEPAPEDPSTGGESGPPGSVTGALGQGSAAPPDCPDHQSGF